MLIYPAVVQAEESGFFVSFPDIPEALTQAMTEADVQPMAEDALLTAMDFYIEDERPVPLPSKVGKGQVGIALPASAAAKVLLLNEMLAQKVTPSALARRLKTTPQSVNRLVKIRHPTKIDAIDGALKALGRNLELVLR